MYSSGSFTHTHTHTHTHILTLCLGNATEQRSIGNQNSKGKAETKRTPCVAGKALTAQRSCDTHVQVVGAGVAVIHLFDCARTTFAAVTVVHRACGAVAAA